MSDSCDARLSFIRLKRDEHAAVFRPDEVRCELTSERHGPLHQAGGFTWPDPLVAVNPDGEKLVAAEGEAVRRAYERLLVALERCGESANVTLLLGRYEVEVGVRRMA